jgi:chemotaxis methyl-accepting protein methylase/PAS domain-containing protein
VTQSAPPPENEKKTKEKKPSETQPTMKFSPGELPIVGIGCSAGGLEALEKFFQNVQPDVGIAFVIVQHLDPNHPSALPDLVQRIAHLPVMQVTNRMKIEANHIYIIPPDQNLSLHHGLLHLSDPPPQPALRLPVDFFLRSLAEDRSEKAIGVILSGMGSDGMLGLKAIKEKGGLGLAQDPGDAKFNSMPQSAIDAGIVDLVAPAAELPQKISAYLNQTLHLEDGAAALAPPAARSALKKIITLLRNRSGNDFSDYKTSTLYRRIERRIALHQLDGINGYVRYLYANPQELDLLFKELLIGVTSFFRDPNVWDLLRDTVLPELIHRHRGGAALRAWVPACSSGEEAYSLAIVFKEALEKVRPEDRYTLQIYATDIDEEAIARARKGVYPDNIAADVSPERLSHFFVHEKTGHRINKEIRDMVIFAAQNLISDPPFTKIDLLCCRNLLIYFGPVLQKKLMPMFHYALNHDGFLVLGSAETVGNANFQFQPLDSKSRIYRRLVDHSSQTAPLEFSPVGRPTMVTVSPPAGEAAGQSEAMERQVDQFIQQQFAPPAVLVNGDGDILYISGRTGKYLEPAAGKVNINIHAMAREGLREALTGVIRNAQRQVEPIRLNGLRIGTNGGTQWVNLVVQGLTNPEALRGRVLIVFYDIAPPNPGKGRRKSADLETLETEMKQTREALRVAHEEMQSSLEEYQSTNEELQSANEELQSTNEELTTSKEELQSLNEELLTVNAELLSKVDELNGVRNDMTNLLNSTHIATVFLDNEMKLRRFTQHATALFKLIPNDIGRKLSDIVTDLDYPTLINDAQEVLNTLVFHESQAKTHDGRWFRVRIMPYRTMENLIDGVVITFIDISEVKQLEAKLH